MDKAFRIPNDQVEEANDMDELQHNVRHPTKDVHIVPGIERDSLLSIPKFVNANYIVIFDKDKVNIYDANKTSIIVSHGAIFRGWRCRQTNLWRIPLIKEIKNNNIDTVLCDQCPTEFLPDRPPPNEAIHNVYELKTQPKLVRYYQASAGFPTKPSWLKAIKNKQYASWLGLTWQAANKHYPESKETLKGHGQKTKSGLRSTKMTTESDDNNNNENANAMHLPWPTIKQKEAIIKTFDLSNEAKRLMYTDQTRKFQKKLSCSYQYIMVLLENDSNAILVEAMKNRLAGEMIQAYQILVEHLRSAGLTPKMHILDNECSAKFKEQIKLNNMKYQLVPPHNHRQNIAEKAIQVFKAHFHKYFVRRGQIIPTSFMGQTPWTSGTHTQHAPDFKNDTVGFSICILLGRT